MLKRLILLLLNLLLAAPAMAAISVSIDRDPVVLDESFQLVYRSDEQVSGQPSFKPLEKAFTILNTNQRSSTQIVNGKVSYTQQWVLTLLAKQSGKLQVPPLRFGTQLSPARTINVIAGTARGQQRVDDNVFIEVSVDTFKPYVQAQVIYTVKLFRAIATSNATLSEPVLNGGQAIVDKLGDDRSYEEQRGGRRYVVIERRYVIFPQNSGRILIEPVVFQGQTGTGGFFRFDPFGPSSKTVVKRSKQLQLNVKPIPANYPGDTWLPASNLTVQEQWSVAPDKLQQGEAATRTLILSADGLAASHLPAIDHALPDEFKLYPDQPEFEERGGRAGFIGTRLEKMAVIPTMAGEFVLPAVRLYWWNTVEDRLETAELPERSIRVASVISQQAENNVPAAPGVEEESAGSMPDQSVQTQATSGIWPWVSAVLFCLWLLTMYAWYRARSGNGPSPQQSDSGAALKHLHKQVLIAAGRNDAAATKQALLDWGNKQWPQQHAVNLGQLKPLVNEALQQELDRLNSYLYGRSQQTWRGEDLATQFQVLKIKPAMEDKHTGQLEPLYKA